MFKMKSTFSLLVFASVNCQLLSCDGQELIDLPHFLTAVCHQSVLCLQVSCPTTSVFHSFASVTTSFLEKADDEGSGTAMAETVFGIFVIRQEGAGPADDPEDVGILLEGVEVLNNLRNVPFAVAMLLALVYALNLSYPPELKCTFEALQKIIMEIDGSRLSREVQALKTFLCR
uniref:Uncharacterized protein n=1 Tax=Salarias fasciatus TaxID=181472 RepID=A0A672FHL5_SALFA